MTITSVGYAGDIDAVELTAWQKYLGLQYAATGFLCSIGGAGDRAVTLATGTAFGQGVKVDSDAPIVLNAASVTSGSRWDTVVVRRTWGANVSTIVLVQGTASRAVSTLLNGDPGTVDDQPLWLIRSQSGQTAIQETVDLRPRASRLTFLGGLGIRPNPDRYEYGESIILDDPLAGGGLNILTRRGGAPGSVWDSFVSPDWNNFSLASGVTANPVGDTPGWRVRLGEVELRGIVSRTSGAFTGTGTTIATLPAASGLTPTRRPGNTKEFAAAVNFQSANTCGRIEIGTDGVIKALAPTTNVTHTWISLDGIKFAPAGA